MSKKISKLLSLSLLAIATAACSSTSSNDSAGESESIPIVEENPYGGPAVELPAPDDVLLTVKVHGSQTTFSLNQLLALPVTDLRIYEPFIKQNSQFTGVAMSEIFNSTGISGSDIAITLALNDYAYSNTAEKFIGSNAVIAYQQNGQAIAMDRGGPIRIIFPDGTILSKVLDAWNWSISEIVVE
jgi:hypothetical protein